MRILVIDDDESIRTTARLLLVREGYSVTTASNGRTGLDAISATPFDLVVLDWTMPELNGLETCRELRRVSAVPVLMLTGRSSERDKVIALDVGADDYLTKPFGPREFLARVRALVRRSRQASPEMDERRFVVGDLTIDPRRGEVRIRGERVFVTPTELRLLVALAISPGEARVPRELVRDLGMSEVSDHDAAEILKVNVMRLRRKIEDVPARPRRLVTHRGFGYSLNAIEAIHDPVSGDQPLELIPEKLPDGDRPE